MKKNTSSLVGKRSGKMLVYRLKKDDDAVFFVLIVVALCEVGS